MASLRHLLVVTMAIYSQFSMANECGPLMRLIPELSKLDRSMKEIRDGRTAAEIGEVLGGRSMIQALREGSFESVATVLSGGRHAPESVSARKLLSILEKHNEFLARRPPFRLTEVSAERGPKDVAAEILAMNAEITARAGEPVFDAYKLVDQIQGAVSGRQKEAERTVSRMELEALHDLLTAAKDVLRETGGRELGKEELIGKSVDRLEVAQTKRELASSILAINTEMAARRGEPLFSAEKLADQIGGMGISELRMANELMMAARDILNESGWSNIHTSTLLEKAQERVGWRR